MKYRIITLLAAVMLTAAAAFADGIAISHGPYLQNITETSATIVWTCNRQSTGWVELAPDDGSNFYACERPRYYDTNIGIRVTDTIHAVRLSGLQPGVVYRYRIYSQEVLSHHGFDVRYGQVAATNVFSQKPLAFRTNDRSKPSTSFVVLNDIHARQNLITPLLRQAGYEKRDMVIYNGDMVSQLNSQDDLFTGFMDESVGLFAKEKTFYYVRGNHETRGAFATEIQRYFCPREPHLYYSFLQGPVFFIMLDTGEDKPDTDIEYSSITDYDNYRTEQAEWLKAVVQTDDFKSARYKVVIAHVPPQTDAEGAWHGPKEVAAKFVPILNDAGIDLMICAHLHRTIYYKPDAMHKFPVIVNSNNTCLTGDTEGGKLNIAILDAEGKKSFAESY